MIFLKEIHFYSEAIMLVGALHHCFYELVNGDLSRGTFVHLSFLLGIITVYQRLTQLDLSKCNVRGEFECTGMTNGLNLQANIVQF